MKFTKKELQRLNCNDEEIALVMEYQRKLPILCDNEGIEGLCINARTLWKQLNSGIETATQLGLIKTLLVKLILLENTRNFMKKMAFALKQMVSLRRN